MKHVEALVQRPRRLGRPQRGPLVRLRGRGLPLHGKPCQRGRPHAAASGMRSVVLIPSDLEQGKVAGTVVLGGDVIAVDGSYDDVNRFAPSFRRAGRGLRQTQHASLLRGRLKSLAFEMPSSSAGVR